AARVSGGGVVSRPVADHRAEPLHCARIRSPLRRRAAEARRRIRLLAGVPLRPAPARSWRDPARARHHRTAEAHARGLRRSGGALPDGRAAGPASLPPADGERRARAAQPHRPLRGALAPRDPAADHMNLATTYLGLSLPHPLMPGASPLVDDLDMVRRLEDAGAAAIVMHSLFEEQIAAEEQAAIHVAAHGDSFGEALSYL